MIIYNFQKCFLQKVLKKERNGSQDFSALEDLDKKQQFYIRHLQLGIELRTKKKILQIEKIIKS